MEGLRPVRVLKSVTNSSQFLCNLFSIMIIFDKFRALDSQHLQPLPCRNSVAGRFAPLDEQEERMSVRKSNLMRR